MYTKIVIIWDVKLQDLKTLRFINSAKNIVMTFGSSIWQTDQVNSILQLFFFLRNKIGF